MDATPTSGSLDAEPSSASVTGSPSLTTAQVSAGRIWARWRSTDDRPLDGNAGKVPNVLAFPRGVQSEVAMSAGLSDALDRGTQRLLRELRLGLASGAAVPLAEFERVGTAIGARALIQFDVTVSNDRLGVGALANTSRRRTWWSSVSPALQALMDERASWTADTDAFRQLPNERLVLWQASRDVTENASTGADAVCSSEPEGGDGPGVEGSKVDSRRGSRAADDDCPAAWADLSALHDEPTEAGRSVVVEWQDAGTAVGFAPRTSLSRVLRGALGQVMARRRCAAALVYRVPFDLLSDTFSDPSERHDDPDGRHTLPQLLQGFTVVLWEFAEVPPALGVWSTAQGALLHFNEALIALIRAVSMHRVRAAQAQELREMVQLGGVSRLSWWPDRNLFRYEGPWFETVGLGAKGECYGLGAFVGMFSPVVRSELQRRLLRPTSRVLTQPDGFERVLAWQVPGQAGRSAQTGWVLLRMQTIAPDVAGDDFDVSTKVVGTLVDITAVKERERVAQLERRQLDQIVGQAPIALFSQVLDGDNVCYHYISASGERLFGLSAKTAARWSVFHERVHPGDWPLLQTRTQRLRRDGVFSAEYRIRVPERGWCWVQEESTCLNETEQGTLEIVGVWLDISDRKAAEARQRSIEGLYRDLVENAPAMIAVLDADFSLKFFNSIFSEYFSETLESSTGRRFLDLLCESERDRFRREAELCSPDAPCRSLEVRLLSPNKEIRWVHWSMRAFRDAQGRVEEYQIVGRDNTELRDAQNQLFHAARLSEVGKLAVGIGHEINQPLNVIKLATTNALAMLKPDVPPDPTFVRAKFKRVAEQVERITKIIELLRSYGRRVDQGDESFSPTVALEGALLLLNERLRRANIRIVREFDPQPGRVRGSVVQLEQVLVNLLSNAIDAIESHRARSQGAPVEASIRLRSGPPVPGQWSLEVVDQGGGIPAWVLPRLFDPFFTTKEPGKGTGLGLSVSRELMTRLRGTLDARNEGDGACFTLTLPLISESTDVDQTSVGPSGAALASRATRLFDDLRAAFSVPERPADGPAQDSGGRRDPRDAPAHGLDGARPGLTDLEEPTRRHASGKALDPSAARSFASAWSSARDVAAWMPSGEVRSDPPTFGSHA